MSKLYSYPWAILYGLYFYVLFQIVFFVQFGQFNRNLGLIDLFVVLDGILSVLLLQYLARKLPTRRGFLIIPFLIALPFAYIGALGGGLLGAVGVVVMGMLPFIVFLGIGYWVVKRVVSRSEIQ